MAAKLGGLLLDWSKSQNFQILLRIYTYEMAAKLKIVELNRILAPEAPKHCIFVGALLGDLKS